MVGAGRGSSCAALNHYLMGITQLDPINIPNGWFTLGGNIGQMKLSADKYVYAKAVLEDPAGFITLVQAHEHMPVSDVEDVIYDVLREE